MGAAHISIHALREEGDRHIFCRCAATTYFYPRPPRGGRRFRVGGVGGRVFISIHALREEGDRTLPVGLRSVSDFYPRPPRGGRLFRMTRQIITQRFLSTPSARRATAVTTASPLETKISIHALREEGDPGAPYCKPVSCNFYPRPPRGGRHSMGSAKIGTYRISIHALREEGDTGQ